MKKTRRDESRPADAQTDVSTSIREMQVQFFQGATDTHLADGDFALFDDDPLQFFECCAGAKSGFIITRVLLGFSEESAEPARRSKP